MRVNYKLIPQLKLIKAFLSLLFFIFSKKLEVILLRLSVCFFMCPCSSISLSTVNRLWIFFILEYSGWWFHCYQIRIWWGNLTEIKKKKNLDRVFYVIVAIRIYLLIFQALISFCVCINLKKMVFINKSIISLRNEYCYNNMNTFYLYILSLKDGIITEN